MAVCRHCRCEYAASERDISKGDYECPPCRRKRQKEWRARRKAEGRPVISGRPSPEWEADYRAKYYQIPEVKARRAEKGRLRAKNPLERHKHEARWLTNRAIASGRLIKEPCEQCGLIKVDAHHDDYSKPFDVRWLCRKHHQELHARATGGEQ